MKNKFSYKVSAATILLCTTLILTQWVKAALSESAQLQASQNKLTTLSESIRKQQDKLKRLKNQRKSLDKSILAKEQSERNQRVQILDKQHTIKRNLKLERFTKKEIEQNIILLDNQINLTLRNSQRTQEYFDNLNAIKRQWEAANFAEKLEENRKQIDELQTKKKRQQQALQKANETLAKLQQDLDTLQNGGGDEYNRLKQLLSERSATEKQIKLIEQQLGKQIASRDSLKQKITDLEKTVRKEKTTQQRQKQVAQANRKIAQQPPAAIIRSTAKPKTYVYLITGKDQPFLEKQLRLKKWVESYQAEFKEASWKNFDFAVELRQTQPQDKLILIGQGLGGGAAIRAATETAYQRNRTVALLAVIDPVGENQLRANIVYDTDVTCPTPSRSDIVTNNDYLACVKTSKPRKITANVRHFYNRWQKQAPGPEDYFRSIRGADHNGNNIFAPTATGRFITSASVKENQQRLFFSNESLAQQLIVEQQAKQLPRLLVKYLR